MQLQRIPPLSRPEKVLPDTIPVADTVKVTAILNVTDTAAMYAEGSDSIVVLQNDTTKYIAQSDSSATYYIGNALDILPFEKPADTTAYYYATDSSAYYIPKEDTLVYSLTKKDSTNIKTDEEVIELKIIGIIDNITIKIGDEPKIINKGLYGVHTPGIFEPGHLNEVEDDNYLEGWQALSDLHPSSLRFPGGADTRWNHPVDYDKNWDGIPDAVKGYGLDIYEIIRYFDVTEDEDIAGTDEIESDNLYDNIQVGILGTAITIESIIDDLEDISDFPDETVLKPVYICDECENWMDAAIYKEEFQGLYGKWAVQESLPIGQKYIDQFIDLITKIETDNHIKYPDDPGYKVDVLVDLSIPGMSATECWNEVEYLRSHNVHVAGVEMGNEVYYGWAMDMMGFNTFENYYNFLQGDPADAEWSSAYYDYVYGPPTGVIGDYAAGIVADKICNDHNYIKKFKEGPLLHYKIGLPAENLIKWPDPEMTGTDEPPFERTVADWNHDLGFAYPNMYNLILHKFDAVILHPYYEAGTGGWEHIPVNNLCPVYPTISLYDCAPKLTCDFTADQWQYDFYDYRLKKAFNGIMGFPILTIPGGILTPLAGNFSDFLRKRYKQFYLDLDAELKFSETDGDAKELWETEKSLKSDKSSPVTSIYFNTFAHGYFTMEGFLKDMKINTDVINFRPDFFTYSHYHSYAGGGWQDLLQIADCSDKLNRIPALIPFIGTGPVPAGYYIEGAPYWEKRTIYYTYYLLSEIVKQKLDYLPGTFTMPALPGMANSINQPPTVFIDKQHKKLIIYFSNVKGDNQNYMVQAGNLINQYPGAISISFENAEFHTVDAKESYSSSGKNSLFANSNGYQLNTCYLCGDPDEPDNSHPFEIQGITIRENIPECTGLVASDAECVTAHGYSFGYFEIIYHVHYPFCPTCGGPCIGCRESTVSTDDVFIYPNPAYDYFNLKFQSEDVIDPDQEIEIIITNLEGRSVGIWQITQFDNVDISNLPPGPYQVIIEIGNNERILKSLIKMK